MKSSSRAWRAGALALPVVLAAQAWAGPALTGFEEAREAWAGFARLATVLAFVVLSILGKIILVTFTLSASQLKPAVFRRGREILRRSPVKSFIVGLVDIFLLLVAGMALANVRRPVPVLIGTLLLLGLLVVLLAGRGIFHQLLGTRLTGEIVDPDGAPSARSHWWGGVTLELALLTPFIGQIAEIWISILAAGAFILALLSRDRSAQPAAERPPAE